MQAAPLPDIVDIIAPVAPPPAPPSYGWWLLTACLILLIFFAVYYTRYRRNRVRNHMLAQLGQARNALHHQEITPRAAAFAVGQALQYAPQLTAPEADPHLFELLDRARYAPQEPEHDTALQLLEMAQNFIAVKS